MVFTGVCSFFDEINAPFIDDNSVPDHEPLSFPVSTATEGVIQKVDATKAFHLFELKPGTDDLFNSPLGICRRGGGYQLFFPNYSINPFTQAYWTTASNYVLYGAP